MKKLHKLMDEMKEYGKKHTEKEFLDRYIGYDLITVVHVFWDIYGHLIPEEYRG